jgi:hypothetical protein
MICVRGLAIPDLTNKHFKMRKKIIALLFVLVLAGRVKAAIQFTVHVTSSTTFEVWMSPDASITTGPAGISSLGLTFETPSTVDPSGTPSPSTGKWGVVSNPALFPSSPALLSTQFKKNASGNWESNFNWNNGTGAANQAFGAGTEYLLATITIPAGLQMSDVTIKDWLNNRVDNAGAPTWGVSIAMGTAPDGIENPASLFYASSGSTAAVTNGGNTAATSTLGMIAVPLPLNFLSFDAGKSGQTAWLKWKTANERNVKEFLVQRSFDGTDWVTLGTVAAAGGSGTNAYSYSDEAPGSAANYYRVAEQDVDGALVYTGVRIVSFGTGDNLTVSLYPVPATTMLTVTVNSPKAQQAVLRITDMAGRVVALREVQLLKGVVTLPGIDVHRLAAGTYSIRIGNDQMMWSGKIIKQ